MHNLHFIVCNADSGEEACLVAAGYVGDWGDEDNWKTMCGAISEKNEIYDAKDGRNRPLADDTINFLNKMVGCWARDNRYEEDAMNFMNALVGGAAARPDKLNSQDAWALKRYAERLYQTIDLMKELKGKPYNIFKHSFFAWKFDENGVTNFVENEKGKKWVVFMDMHS